MKLQKKEYIEFIKATDGDRNEPARISVIFNKMEEKFGKDFLSERTFTRKLRKLIGETKEEVDKQVKETEGKYEYGYVIIDDAKIGFKRTVNGKIVGYWYERNNSDRGESIINQEFGRYLADSIIYSKVLDSSVKLEYYGALCDLLGKGTVREANEFEKEIMESKYFDIEGDSDPIDVMKNVRTIQSAIAKCKKIKFKLFFYDYIEGKVRPNTDCKEWCVSPLQIMMNNGRYYLMAVLKRKIKKFFYFRIDLMAEIIVLDTQKSEESENKEWKDPQKFLCANPYFYSGDKETVVLGFESCQLTQVYDWFGAAKDDISNNNGLYEIKGVYQSEKPVKKNGKRKENEKIEIEEVTMVKIKFPDINVNAFSFWVMQYIDCLEILEGDRLKEIVRERMTWALENRIKL